MIPNRPPSSGNPPDFKVRLQAGATMTSRSNTCPHEPLPRGVGAHLMKSFPATMRAILKIPGGIQFTRNPTRFAVQQILLSSAPPAGKKAPPMAQRNSVQNKLRLQSTQSTQNSVHTKLNPHKTPSIKKSRQFPPSPSQAQKPTQSTRLEPQASIPLPTHTTIALESPHP